MSTRILSQVFFKTTVCMYACNLLLTCNWFMYRLKCLVTNPSHVITTGMMVTLVPGKRHCNSLARSSYFLLTNKMQNANNLKLYSSLWIDLLRSGVFNLHVFQ